MRGARERWAVPRRELCSRVPFHEVGAVADVARDLRVGTVGGIATQLACRIEPWPEQEGRVRRKQALQVTKQLNKQLASRVDARGRSHWAPIERR